MTWVCKLLCTAVSFSIRQQKLNISIETKTILWISWLIYELLKESRFNPVNNIRILFCFEPLPLPRIWLLEMSRVIVVDKVYLSLVSIRSKLLLNIARLTMLKQYESTTCSSVEEIEKNRNQSHFEQFSKNFLFLFLLLTISAYIILIENIRQYNRR